MKHVVEGMKAGTSMLPVVLIAVVAAACGRSPMPTSRPPIVTTSGDRAGLSLLEYRQALE